MNLWRERWESDCGSVVLYCGDCLDVLPTLNGVDCVVTDPPYSIKNKFGTQKRTNGTRALQWEWDDICSPEYVAERVSAAVDLVSPKGSVACWCGLDQVGLINDLLRKRGFIPKMMSWVKQCPPPPMPGNWWTSGFELGIYGYRPGAWFGDESASRPNVWVHDSYRHGQPGKVDHPTQKPIELIDRLVRGMVPREGIAVDGFMGSGTTGVACVRLGRRFIGIEREPKYFAIAKRRIQDELRRVKFLDPTPPKQKQKTLLDEITGAP